MTLPDIDTLATLGGELVNAEPVLDATTDLDAGADSKSRANVAMMTHTSPRAMRRFTGHATTPTDPASGFVHDAQWGNVNANKPTLGIAATVYTVTWPATVQDELLVSHALNFRIAKAWVEVAGGTYYAATARVLTANSVEVRVFTAAGALDAAAGLNIVVMVW